MTEPRKPIFGFLWGKPDPNAPLDADYRQVRRIRVASRGPIRIAALLVLTIAVVTATGSMIMGGVAVGLTPLTVVGAAVVATGLVLVLRGWVVGTYVNDDGLLIETTLRRTSVAWTEVASVSNDSRPCPFLGMPLRVDGTRVSVTTRDGRSLATHVYASSPDLWLRPEAFDMARLRLERWSQDS